FFFILYLSLSSACFILLGALGQRYAAMSFGTILLSLYSMFGLGEYSVWYFQPSCFVLGALWYGCTAIVFYILKPTLAVQDNLARCFNQVADLLNAKARLFDPDNRDNVEALLYDLSLQNSTVVQSLNNTKSSLLTRLKAARANQNTIYWLNLYFLVQDIHEQASSNYLHYEQLHQNFSRTDLIFRIQKNIRLQALACQALARCILTNQTYASDPATTQALLNLHSSMQDWIRDHPHNIEVKNLQLILNNLDSVHERFQHLNELQSRQEQRYQQHIDNLNLYDDDIHDWHDLWLKLSQHLTPQSALFRHAVRIAFVFAVGYGISLLPFAQHGYWILLTSLFVCQMRYFATKSRLKMRTLGTILGVVLGIPLLYFVPSIEGQLLLTIIFGVCFFYLSSKKYAMATLMATLMVLLIFNLKGAGYAIILPRIIDTLIGCAIAWFAVSFIWPDWDFRNISNTIKKASDATLHYFDAICEQYQQGKNNSLAYRSARRTAHNA
ncbi:MAG: YccS family putative transporter, partial [Acinetobacter sp.]